MRVERPAARAGLHQLPAALAQLTGLRALQLDSRTSLSLGAACLGRLSSVSGLELRGAGHTLWGLALMPSLKFLSLAACLKCDLKPEVSLPGTSCRFAWVRPAGSGPSLCTLLPTHAMA